MTNRIDICGRDGCTGRLKIISLTRDERIRRRIGRALISRCSKCGSEIQMSYDAYRRFVKGNRERKRAEQEKIQPSLF